MYNTRLEKITIVGGGLVGLTIANLLADLSNHNNIKIDIFEPNVPMLKWDKNSFDLRCYSINLNSKKIFKSLHLDNKKTQSAWDLIAKTPYNTMRVWDATGFGEINFNSTDINQYNLGYIVENRELILSLWERLKKYKNIDLIISNFDLSDFNRDIHSKNNFIHSDNHLIIAADGAKSKLRSLLNIDLKITSLQQKSLVAVVRSQKSHNYCATQRFKQDGPLAFLPLKSEFISSIVWSSSPENINRLEKISDLDFCKELSLNFEGYFGNIELLTRRASFPIKSIHAKQYFKNNVVLVGDAAHAIHPLAGQGVNLGLKDAEVLSDIIKNYIGKNQNFNLEEILKNYQKQQKGENLTMLEAMNNFKSLFGSNNKVLWFLRNYGLNLTNNLNFIKKEFMLKACGLK